MSKFIVGTTVGLALGYIAAKMMDEKFMDKMNSEMTDLTAKAKRKAKDLMDKGQNEAEYVMEKGKMKVEKAME